MNCDVCICKELYAECRVVGGTAVFQELVERMTAPIRLNIDYKLMRQSMEAERFIGDTAKTCYCISESVQS